MLVCRPTTLEKTEISLHKWVPTFHAMVGIPERLCITATLYIYKDHCQGIKQHLSSNEEVKEPLLGIR
jgi:hypothetical protein